MDPIAGSKDLMSDTNGMQYPKPLSRSGRNGKTHICTFNQHSKPFKAIASNGY